MSHSGREADLHIFFFFPNSILLHGHSVTHIQLFSASEMGGYDSFLMDGLDGDAASLKATD